MASAELAVDTVADSLLNEETRASILHALEAPPAPIPHELALAVAPALVDVAVDTQDREAFDRCTLLVGRLLAEAAPEPSRVYAAALGGERMAAYIASRLHVEATQRALETQRSAEGGQPLTHKDAYSFACLFAWVAPHSVRGSTAPEQAAGRDMLQYMQLFMSADPIGKERMPTDGVPRQLLTLLIELLRQQELPGLAMGGAWHRVNDCMAGRPALGPVALKLGLPDLSAEHLRALGSPADAVSISRGKAGLAYAVLAGAYGMLKAFEGQQARPDVEACVSSGLFEINVQMVAAFASAGVDGLPDTDHSALALAMMMLSRCGTHPCFEQSIRGLATALTFCLEHPLSFMDELGITSGSLAARLCCAVFGRDEEGSSEFEFTSHHVEMLVEGWSQTVRAVGYRKNSKPTADTFFAAQLCVSDKHKPLLIDIPHFIPYLVDALLLDPEHPRAAMKAELKAWCQQHHAEALAQLAVHEASREALLRNNSVVPALRKVSEEGLNKEAQQFARDALLALSEAELQRSDKEQKHISLSYHWDHQKIMVQINESLRRRGYLTRPPNPGDPTNGIEDAGVLLYGASLSYKESATVRQPNEHEMIPLMVQRDYRPEGWLALLMGSRKCYTFWGAEMDDDAAFERSIDAVCEEIGEHCKDLRRDGTAEVRAASIERVHGNDPAVTEVSWSYTGVRDDEVIRLSEALKGNVHVDEILLHGNRKLTDSSVASLATSIGQSEVRRVELKGCENISEQVRANITTACVSNCVKLVTADNQQTTRVDLSTMDLQDKHINKLCEALRDNTHVVEINLSGNECLSDAGLENILAAIPRSNVAKVDVQLTGASDAMQKKFEIGALRVLRQEFGCFRLPTEDGKELVLSFEDDLIIIHESDTSSVCAVLDVRSKRRLVLKFMHELHQYNNEIEMRKEGERELPSTCVVSILAHNVFTPEQLSIQADQCKLRTPSAGVISSFGRHVLLLERGNRDLADIISRTKVAGSEMASVAWTGRSLATCLLRLEHSRRIHGDVKSRNVMEFRRSGRPRGALQLIDMDASTHHGGLAGEKWSSAYSPPELAQLIYDWQCGPSRADHASWQDYLKAGPASRQVLASTTFDVWSFGMVLYSLASPDGVMPFHVSISDNIVRNEDLKRLAYHWEESKLTEVSKLVWPLAQDLVLWCLQTHSSRRPQSFADILQHPFLLEHCPRGWLDHYPLRFLSSASDDFGEASKQHAEQLHRAIESGSSEAVKELFDHGGVHLKMLDSSIKGSTVTPIMRAAFVGEKTTADVLLNEIEDSWPECVRKEYLDQRTSLGFTAYMIACARGHEEVAKLIKDKGCSTNFVNDLGQTGDRLLQAAHDDHESPSCASLSQTHESLEAYLALLDRKAIVMSCPETGTLKPDGSGPYNQPVMEKINELRLRGRLKGGFDRAGSSNKDSRDDETWPKIFKTSGQADLFETDEKKRKELIKSTYWFTGYRTAAKAQMNLECQTFHGTLEVICIKGGPITDVEHEEMDRIIEEARLDAATNKIQSNIQLRKVSYYEFLRDYDPDFLQSKIEEPAHGDGANADDGSLTARHGDVARSKVDARDGVSDLTDRERRMQTQLEKARAELVAKDAELQQLRAQLAPLEGVPPQRD